MSYRQYFRLEHAEPAGALILRNHDHEVTEYDCDVCGKTMGPHNECALDVGAYRRAGSSGHVRVSLDLCDRCLMRLPRPILERFAGYGLDLPGLDAAGDSEAPVMEPRR